MKPHADGMAHDTESDARRTEIDARKGRARSGHFLITNVGEQKVFSEYTVENPESGKTYRITIRGFQPGDNHCTCEDFKTNALGTCKHVEAVLLHVKPISGTTKGRRPVVAIPEVEIDPTRAARTVRIRLPKNPTDAINRLVTRHFGNDRRWNNRHSAADLLVDLERAAQTIVVQTEARAFLEYESDRSALAAREQPLLDEWSADKDGLPLSRLLRCPLYDYQIRGSVFLACRGRAILADDMGLGKTVQTLAAVELLARERRIERVLIIAPSSVKYQWEEEIRRFTDRSAVVIDGPEADRRSAYADPSFYKLVNYELVNRDEAAVQAWQPDVIVLDEAQRIKNWESKTSRTVKRLRSRFAFVLTGTPLENRLEELYSIVQFVDDHALGPAYQFLHDHRHEDENGRISYRGLDKVRERLAPMLIRRTRSEVLDQLPERTDRYCTVEMTEPQRIAYEQQRSSLAALVHRPRRTEGEQTRILACLANMRMACNSTYLLDHATHHSSKLEEFGVLILDLLEDGHHKAVVFSQWERMIDRASDKLKRLGIGHTVLHGGLSGSDRKRVVAEFKESPDCRVFLSTDAGQTGLNLQAADIVINLEPPWNPAVLEQRIARVHRLGQERKVRVFHFVTRDSIEDRMLRTLDAKRALFDGVFDPREDGSDPVGGNGSADLHEAICELADVRTEAVRDRRASADVKRRAEWDRIAAASVALLEALADWSDPPPLDAELCRRFREAVAALQSRFAPIEPPDE